MVCLGFYRKRFKNVLLVPVCDNAPPGLIKLCLRSLVQVRDPGHSMRRNKCVNSILHTFIYTHYSELGLFCVLVLLFRNTGCDMAEGSRSKDKPSDLPIVLTKLTRATHD